MKVHGYAYIRRGRIHGFDKTKRGLLIGYDMMPLIGLRQMERRLLKRGTIERVTLALGRCRWWGAVLDGKPSIDFAAFGGSLYRTRGIAESVLAGYVMRNDMPAEERIALYSLWMPSLRSRRGLAAAQCRGREVIAASGHSLARMRFVRIGAGS